MAELPKLANPNSKKEILSSSKKLDTSLMKNLSSDKNIKEEEDLTSARLNLLLQDEVFEEEISNLPSSLGIFLILLF